MSAGIIYAARVLPKKQKIAKPKWRQWIELILNTGSKFGLTKACIARQSGDIMASVKGLELQVEDFEEISKAFNSSQSEVLRFSGTTYCIKIHSGKQVIAFNGGTYLIVTRSKTLFIIAICTCKTKLEVATTWLERIGDSID